VFAIYMGALERTLQVQTKCLTIVQISIVLRANNYAGFQCIEYSNSIKPESKLFSMVHSQSDAGML
jgi:hypothetical protein